MCGLVGALTDLAVLPALEAAARAAWLAALWAREPQNGSSLWLTGTTAYKRTLILTLPTWRPT